MSVRYRPFLSAAVMLTLLACGLSASPDITAEADEQIDEALVDELLDLGYEDAGARIEGLELEMQVRYALILAQMNLSRGRGGIAHSWAERAESKAGELDDSALLADVLYVRSGISEARGNVRAAVAQTRRAAELYAEARRPSDELTALSVLANTQHRVGLLSDGIETAREIIPRIEEMERPVDRGNVLTNAAMMHYKLGDFEPLPALLDDAEAIFESENELDGLGTVYRIRGNYYGAIGDSERALEFYGQAAELYERTGNTHDFANISFNTGLAELDSGRYEGAIGFFEDAVDGFLEAGSYSGAGMASTELAVALWISGDLRAAESSLSLAIGLLEASQSLRRLARAYSVRASIQGALDDSEGARESLNEARNLYDELGLRREADRIQDQLDGLGDSQSRGGI